MINPTINFVGFIHQQLGDIGLFFFLIIIAINLFGIWLVLPKRVQHQIAANPNKAVMLQRTLHLHQIIVLLISGIFSLGVVVAPEPALWLKIFSSVFAMFIFTSLVYSIWLLIIGGFRTVS